MKFLSVVVERHNASCPAEHYAGVLRSPVLVKRAGDDHLPVVKGVGGVAHVRSVLFLRHYNGTYIIICEKFVLKRELVYCTARLLHDLQHLVRKDS